MKINYAIWHTNCTGGTRVIFNIINGLIDRGHEVVVSSVYGDHSWFPLRAKVKYVPQRINYGRNSSLLGIFSLAKIMEEADVSVATFSLTAYPVHWNGKGKKFYHVQHYEPYFFDSLVKLPLRPLIKHTYKLPLNIISSSTWVRNMIKEKIKRDSAVITAAIDTNIFRVKEKIDKIFEKEKGIKRVVALGKAKRWKGLLDLFEAMSIINKKRKDVELVLYGVEDLKLKSPVKYKFMKNIDDGSLVDLYNSADVVVNPSWYESFPLLPLEAMACGTPIVTTRYGTEDYAFNEENSLVVPPRRPDKLAEAILRVINDKYIREKIIKNGLKTAKEFNWKKTVNNFEKAFKNSL